MTDLELHCAFPIECGVFRCTTGFQEEFGSDRVFNTPLTEQGVVGAAINAAAESMRLVVEIQFKDYVFPAFDEIVNEASKFRCREGSTGANVGGLVIRMPWGVYIEKRIIHEYI